MADALGLGPSEATHGGSSPLTRTMANDFEEVNRLSRKMYEDMLKDDPGNPAVGVGKDGDDFTIEVRFQADPGDMDKRTKSFEGVQVNYRMIGIPRAF